MQLSNKKKLLMFQLISVVFFFFIPIRVIFIGNGNGWGIQGINYQYQITSYGSSFIPLNNEIGYVIYGNITGLTAYSIIFDALGSILFLFWFILLILTGTNGFFKRRYILLIFSLVASAIGDFVQYGPIGGPAGVVIPLYIIEFLILSLFDHGITK